jgi:hypothetical protein
VRSSSTSATATAIAGTKFDSDKGRYRIIIPPPLQAALDKKPIPTTAASKLILCSRRSVACTKELLMVSLREFELTKIFSYLQPLSGLVTEIKFYGHIRPT